MELKIVTHIKEKGLADAIREFKLKSRVYEHKILLKYDQIASSMGIKEVQECRGLILEKDTWKIMSLAFEKFFNAEEGHAAKIDWDSAKVLEKCDGSLIQVYWDWHKNKWFAATSGTAEGEGEVNNKLGTTFHSLFWDTVIEKYNFNKCLLNKDNIYVFELMTPYNIVVAPHGESKVSLLAVRNRETFNEVAWKDLGMIAESLNVPLVKAFDMNVDNVGAIKRTFEGMPFSEEGYVVVDKFFNRIKIKNPAYVSVHHLKSKTSEHAIMGVVKSNEIDEFSATFPDRQEEIERLKKGYDELIEFLEGAWEGLKEHRPKNITPKEKKRYAMEVFKVVDGEDERAKAFSGMFFSLNEYKVASVKEWMFNFDNKRLYNMV